MLALPTIVAPEPILAKSSFMIFDVVSFSPSIRSLTVSTFVFRALNFRQFTALNTNISSCNSRIDGLNDSLVCEVLGIRMASASYTMVSNASCVFHKSFAAISVVIRSTTQISADQALFAMNTYQPKFKGRLSMIYGAQASSTVAWRDAPDEGSGGVTWCYPAISISANTPVAIIGTLAVEPL